MRDVCDCLTNVSSSLLNNATCYLWLLFLSIIWPLCFQYTYARQQRPICALWFLNYLEIFARIVRKLFTSMLQRYLMFPTLKNNLVNFKDTTAKKFSRRDQIKSPKFQKYHKTQSTKMQELEITFRGTSRKTNQDEAIVLRPQLFRRKSSLVPLDTRIIPEITRREGGVYNWGPSNRSRRNWTMESRRCR